MAAKLTFQDVFNNEIAPSKFLASPVYFSYGAGNPAFSAPTGSLYINSTTGGFFLNISSPTPGTTWVELSNNNTNDEIGHHRTYTEGSLTITGAGAYTPSVGDLVGTFLSGAWTNEGNLNNSYGSNNTCGGNSQAINAGSDGTTNKLVETWNGSTWASATNLNTDRYYGASSAGINPAAGNLFGSTNGAVCVGGNNGMGQLSSCELYNGSSWSAGTNNVPGGVSAIVGHCAAGTSYSGLIAGDFSSTAFGYIINYNGVNWTVTGPLFDNGGYNGNAEMSASGSLNSVIFNSYRDTGSVNPITFMFNGQSIFTLTTVYNFTYMNAYLSGNPLMAYKAGGREVALAVNYTAAKKTEMFNGVTWNTHVDMNVARIGSQTKSPGSAVNCVVAAGKPQTGNTVTRLNSSESYAETISHKKLYPRYVKSYNRAKLYYGSSSAISRGYQSSVIYPANKYLVVNRIMLTAIGNEADISAGYNVLQVAMSGSLATYSVSSTPSLQIVPGTIAIITAGGANPLSANNIGVFVIKSIIVSSNTIVVANAAGTNQNPGTGTMKFVTTMLCVDYAGPDDIIIGSTDDNGILTMDKFFQTTNYFSRTGF